MQSIIIRLWVPALILLLWQVVSSSEVVNPILLPKLTDAFNAGVNLFSSGAIWQDLGSTAYRFIVGYGIAVIVGIPVGLLIGTFAWIHRSFEFILEFGRSTPVTAFFPLFLLLFGIQDLSKIAMVSVASVFIVILNSAYGVKYASEIRKRVADLYGANRFQRFIYVTFWDALPQIVVGLRTALSLALIVVVVSEMFIGTRFGLGQRIFDAYTVSNSAQLYALLIIIGTTGFVLNRFFIVIETKLVHWGRS